MLKVHRTDTDEIVLIHEPTQSVVVADTFEAAFQRLTERLGGREAELLDPPPPPAPRTEPILPTVWARYALLGVLVALPFVWLGALHVTLGALVVELRRGMHEEDADASEELETDPSVREDLDALGNRVDRLIDDVRTLKRAAKKADKKAASADTPEDAEDGEEGGHGPPTP